MDRGQIEKIAQTPEDRMLLASVWDKIQAGMRRSVPANTSFLSPREQELSRRMLGSPEGLCSFGGYQQAERRMLCWLPEYLEPDYFTGPDSPMACLRATYFSGDTLTHRDFLGALMGAGIARDTVGDICVGEGRCDFFVTAQIAPYLEQSFDMAGRVKLHVARIPLLEASIPEPETVEIRDTVASLRLDGVLSAGFRISRGHAAQHIAAGHAAINGLPCEKPDHPVSQGDTLTIRGLGKVRLRTIGGATKKGRLNLIFDRYV